MCVELGGIGGKKRRVLWRASNRPRVLSNGTRQVAFMTSLRMCNRDAWRWKFSQLTLRFGTRLCARNALPLTTSAPETAAIVSCTGGAGRRRRGDEWTLGLKSLGCGESVRKNPSWISQITFWGTAPSDLELLDNRSMDKTCPKWLCRASREAKSQKSQSRGVTKSFLEGSSCHLEKRARAPKLPRTHDDHRPRVQCPRAEEGTPPGVRGAWMSRTTYYPSDEMHYRFRCRTNLGLIDPPDHDTDQALPKYHKRTCTTMMFHPMTTNGNMTFHDSLFVD